MTRAVRNQPGRRLAGRAPTRRGLILALAFVIALSATVWGWPRPQTAHVSGPARREPGPFQWLSVREGKIVDQDGRSVLLRGFNVDALTDPRDAELGPPTPLTDEDARLMRQAGFDCVRLPIAWSLLEPTPEHFDRAYLARIVGAVRLLERHRLRVVLDMHFGIGWGPRSEIPSWASMTWVPDWRPVHSPPWNESVSPRVAVDEGYFWLADAWQHALAQAWEMVASQFRDDPGVVGYDIYNEPHPLPVPPGLFETRYLFPFYARTISTISHADPNHLFIVESTLFDDLPTTVEPLRAPGVVYAPHLYVGSLTSRPFEQTSPADVGGKVEERVREARTVGGALWFGEVGLGQNDPQAAAYDRAYVQGMARAGSGWAWWQWRQNGGWGIRDAAGTQLDLTALRRLSSPYLEAAPPGVAANADPGGDRLAVHVSASAHARNAIVSWPALLAGRPAAAGTCLDGSTWNGQDATLGLHLRAGPACSLTVTPGG